MAMRLAHSDVYCSATGKRLRQHGDAQIYADLCK